ncbi:MAG: ubiquinol-cytochrome c reductase iron-sulfur subunit [Thermoanaerobaculia bacterium]|nr:ubiquinol-cytochrome c reductase iron-sulfur subunit [Thermoanaerobaculia bacterium]
MAELPRSRRAAVRSLGLLALGAAGLWRFLTPRREATAPASANELDLAEEEVPADGALVLPQHGIAVVRQGEELLALDLACTHLGCTVTATAGGFSCPCHGSRFGACGRVLGGPATEALERVAMVREEGWLRVARGRAAQAEWKHPSEGGFDAA